MKKNIIFLLIVLLAIPLLFASNLTAKLDDGKLAILYSNGTYEIVQKSIPDKAEGYSLEDNSVSFVDINWNSIVLIKGGNFMESTSFMEKDIYTFGVFYLLAIEVENPTDTPLEFSRWNDWENPVIEGSDGKEYTKMSAMCFYLDDTMPYIGDFWDKGLGVGESRTYYQLFDLPTDVKPIKLGVSSIYKKNMKWISLGAERLLE